ncbi:MAG TPA: hypothetical protein VJ917_04945 [Saprospiraceae bacterium]|nr:hypothetical protein [Saprospiraceae bacterium]
MSGSRSTMVRDGFILEREQTTGNAGFNLQKRTGWGAVGVRTTTVQD